MTKSNKPHKTVDTRKPKPGDEDYVGYGHPPKQHRFVKGQSGNKKGRPKGSKNYSTVMRELLQTPVTIMKDGKKKTIPLVEAAGIKLGNKALGGDIRAILELLNKAQEFEVSAEHTARTSTTDDEAALEVFVQRIKSGAYTEQSEDSVETNQQPSSDDEQDDPAGGAAE